MVFFNFHPWGNFLQFDTNMFKWGSDLPVIGLAGWDQNAAWKTPHLNLPMETLEVFLFFVLSPESL